MAANPRRQTAAAAPPRPAAPAAAPSVWPTRPATALDAQDGRRRVVVERVLPEVESGRFAVKRTVGEVVEVTAHVHADGHDVLAVRLRHRRCGNAGAPWTEIAMTPAGNDEWLARFAVGHLGRYEYTVEAWVDHFQTWRHGLAIKVKAGMDVATELMEGAALVAETAARCGLPDARLDDLAAADRKLLDAAAAAMADPAAAALRITTALDARLLAIMSNRADRRLASTYSRILPVSVERERARFGAWYEMFPRSWGPDASRSATFGEAAAHLPRVAALGFDVVYLPPIHPIGISFRKGRGNSLTPGPGDPGSPWAIGSAAGGHKAVDPALGTLDDFDAFVATANQHGLEVALDLAYQCSPDHPYVTAHPEWFRQRPDGTIKYAENPPKKYQDIYPFNFETDAWQPLWAELLDVVRFWIGHGVRIFRVDNPHTKPYAFWEWLIAEIRYEHPDVIFLSEAFTRPKVMGYLAKLGFSQSYSYFTWRNTKTEIEEYFTELTAPGLREYLRPNLFANTPDILHAYLQGGGPAAFKIRLILAATLGASYGIYSGFELCEGRAVPGSEEYLDSEKYQVRHWDWDRPGHIKDLVATVNRIRRDNPALHYDWSLQFHPTDNPQLVAYTKTSPDAANAVFVVVNLDPHNLQHGWVTMPPSAPGATTEPRYEVEDLLTGTRFEWTAGLNYVRLDPAGIPAHILRVPPLAMAVPGSATAGSR